MRTILICTVLAVACLLSFSVTQADSATIETNLWTTHGPYGGTIRALAVDPITPTILYAGSHTAGVFKSTNCGVDWVPATAGLQNVSVFTLAVDPQTPTTLYAGSFGHGAYESIDGGASWLPVNTGLTNRNIRAMAIDPQDLTIIYVGTQGSGLFAIRRLSNQVYLPILSRN